MKSEGEKMCPACFSQIDRRAKKCPHCHAYQNYLRHLVALLVAGIGVLLLAALVGVGILGYQAWELSRELWRPENYADNITVVSSDLYFAPADYQVDAKVITVVGTLRNDGGERVDTVKCQVQAFDADGKLIDYFEESVSTYLMAGESVPFKINPYEAIHTDEANYASHRITITEARQKNPDSTIW